MKTKNVKLEWNILKWDNSKKDVIKYNIFFPTLVDELIKEIKKDKELFTKNDLKVLLDRKFKYYFWCKTECEMLIGDLFYKSEQDFKKVDLYKQIEINLNLIVEYVWNNLELDK